MPRQKGEDLAGSRARILERLQNPGRPAEDVPKPDGPFISSPDVSPAVQFEENLSLVNGTCIRVSGWIEALLQMNRLAEINGWQQIYCPDAELHKHLVQFTPDCIQFNLTAGHAPAIVTRCEALIAETGSILVSSAGSSGRTSFISGDAHIVIASSDQLFRDVPSAFDFLISKRKSDFPSMISVITGPSRTADIEKTLILGAHGPKSLFVLILEQDID